MYLEMRLEKGGVAESHFAEMATEVFLAVDVALVSLEITKRLERFLAARARRVLLTMHGNLVKRKSYGSIGNQVFKTNISPIYSHSQEEEESEGEEEERETKPPVADGWAGADMRVFPLFDSC